MNPIVNPKPVESVESVEMDWMSNCQADREGAASISDVSTKTSLGAVESVAKQDLSSYFSTLSTKMQQVFVEEKRLLISAPSRDLGDFPRIPQIPQEAEDSGLICEWLNIAVTEGHIEPSQPEVGRIIGWPCRSFAASFLHVDFQLWCRKKGIAKWHFPDRSIFCSLADQVFIRVDDRYDFPSMQECRGKFAELRRKYAHI